MKKIIVILKGMFVGGTMTVPGVSGGTMAIIAGIYEELLNAINNLKKDLKNNLLFLGKFALGGAIGFLLIARFVTLLLENSKTEAYVKMLFCGVVLGGIPMLVKKSGIRKITCRDIISIILGLAIVLLLTMLPEGSFSNSNVLINTVLQFISGVIVAVALILPGISATHMLYVLGMYSSILEKIYSLRLIELLPIAIGGIIGTFATAKGLEMLINKHTEEVYMVITGFVMGSVVSLVKGVVITNIFEVMMVVLGFGAMYFISRFS